MSDSNIKQIEEHLKHAETKMLQAEICDAETKEQLYQEATDLLIRAERLMKGSGAWLMSCIHARRDNGPMCIKWLERAKGASMLPDAETIEAHSHFDEAKKKSWFKEWLDKQ